MLGRAAGRGLSFMMSATIVIRITSFVAQILLGFLLTKADFGVFAVALGLAAYLKALQSGGVRLYLLGRPEGGFDDEVGPCYWLATSFNLLAALVIAGMAAFVAVVSWPEDSTFGNPQVPGLILVLAMSALIQAPSMVLNARLHHDLRQGIAARMGMWSAIFRSALTVLLALLGFGPMALAIPFVAQPIFAFLYAYRAHPLRFWALPFKFDRWPSILGGTKWLVASAVLNSLIVVGDYAVAALFVPEVILGAYAFAWQIIAQIGTLVSLNMRTVLVPILSRIGDDRRRMAGALDRSLRVTMLLLPFGTIGIGVGFPGLSHLIWGGKWDPSVGAVLALSVAAPFNAILNLIASPLLASERYRTFTLVVLIQGVAVVIGAWLGASLGGTATLIATGVSASYVLTGPALAILVFRPYGLGVGRTLRAMLLPLGLALACGAVATGVAMLVLPVTWVGHHWSDDPHGYDRIRALVEVLVVGPLYGLLFWGIVRATMRPVLEDLTGQLPGRLARPARRVLLMPPKAAAPPRPAAEELPGERPAPPEDAF